MASRACSTSSIVTLSVRLESEVTFSADKLLLTALLGICCLVVPLIALNTSWKHWAISALEIKPSTTEAGIDEDFVLLFHFCQNLTLSQFDKAHVSSFVKFLS